MAKLVFGMNQSLDGYVDHMAFAPSPALFRHFIEEVHGQGAIRPRVRESAPTTFPARGNVRSEASLPLEALTPMAICVRLTTRWSRPS